MAAVRHLGFVVRMRGITRDVLFVVFITLQNLVRIGSVVLIISKFNNFCERAMEMEHYGKSNTREPV